MISGIYPRETLAHLPRYLGTAKQGRVILSSLAGRNASEKARELQALAAARPRSRVRYWHLFISHDPKHEPLQMRDWHVAARIACQRLALEGAGYEFVLHQDKPHHHLHAMICLVRADGSLVSQAFWRWRAYALAREIERCLGIATAIESDGATENGKTYQVKPPVEQLNASTPDVYLPDIDLVADDDWLLEEDEFERQVQVSQSLLDDDALDVDEDDYGGRIDEPLHDPEPDVDSDR